MDKTLYTYEDPTTKEKFSYGDPTINAADIKSRGLRFVSGPVSPNQSSAPQDPLETISRAKLRGEAATNAGGALADNERKLTENLGLLAGDLPSKDKILADKTAQANAIIDTIKAQFNEIIAGEEKAGARRADRTRALNISSGLGGSDFASSNAQETEDNTNAIINAKKSQRDAQILEVLTGVPSKADEAYAKASELYRTNAETGLKALKDFREGARTRANGVLAAIAGSGASFDDVKNSPEYSRILEAYGDDENAVKGAFVASIPKKDQLGSTTAGNKYIVFYQDPITGAKSSVDFELPQNLKPEETVQQVFTNGQVAIKSVTYDAQGNRKESIRIETPAGFKPKVEGGGDTSTFSPEDTRQLSQAGLSNADRRTREIFINTPTEFRQTYTRNGFGNKEVTPAILLANLEEWEKMKKAEKDGGTENPFASNGK